MEVAIRPAAGRIFFYFLFARQTLGGANLVETVNPDQSFCFCVYDVDRFSLGLLYIIKEEKDPPFGRHTLVNNRPTDAELAAGQ